MLATCAPFVTDCNASPNTRDCEPCSVSSDSPQFLVHGWPSRSGGCFGDKVELAFDSWIWPLLGLIFLPWTTLAFLIAWQPGGLSGNWDVLLIVLGVALDILTYMHRAAAKAVRPAPRY